MLKNVGMAVPKLEKQGLYIICSKTGHDGIQCITSLTLVVHRSTLRVGYFTEKAYNIIIQKLLLLN